ncbi:unnamed protein product [Somion occarium]|uniref:Uncharacterized protein n=1 Tax=Somion occarium TaxID=3059160 RepID=A0ABP1E4A6_9APHY
MDLFQALFEEHSPIGSFFRRVGSNSRFTICWPIGNTQPWNTVIGLPLKASVMRLTQGRAWPKTAVVAGGFQSRGSLSWHVHEVFAHPYSFCSYAHPEETRGRATRLPGAPYIAVVIASPSRNFTEG